jgi:hypothetical protein
MKVVDQIKKSRKPFGAAGEVHLTVARRRFAKHRWRHGRYPSLKGLEPVQRIAEQRAV